MARTRLEDAERLLKSGQPAQAESLCRQILRASPANVAAARLLGQLTRKSGKAAESVRLFEDLRRARPNDLQLVGELGASLTAANMQARALPLLREAVEKMPGAVQWRIWLGRCLLKLLQTGPAIRVLREAHEQSPDDPDARFFLADALLLAARPDEAEPLIRGFLAADPASIPGRMLLANTLEHQHRLEAARVEYGAVLERDPNFDAALAGLARCLRTEGRYEEALAALEPVLQREPTATVVLAVAPIYLAGRRFEDCRALFERVLAQDNVSGIARASLSFGLGEACEGLGDFDRAFEAYRRANECYPRSYSADRARRFNDELRAAFSPGLLADGPRSRHDASRCVFIVGMPRSGSSLVEQILDAHPDIFGAGELLELRSIAEDLMARMGGASPACLAGLTPELLDRGAERYLAHLTALAPDARWVTDKLPHNFEFLGLIRRMLPGAAIIHSRRDPIDTCLSCYFTHLSVAHAYSYHLEDLGKAYGLYEEMMRFWQQQCAIPILDVRYEDTVADLEGQARRILEHIGAPWDDRCLRFHETRRAVTTASVDQVRRPIYKSSVARWKRYETHIGPLIDALRAAGVELHDSCEPPGVHEPP